MSTFRIALKVLFAHKVYVTVYLVLLSFMGLAIGIGATQPTGDEPLDVDVRVTVIDRDGSEVSRGLTDYLGEHARLFDMEDTKRSLQDVVAKGAVQYVAIVPVDFGRDLERAAENGEEAPELECAISYESAVGALVDVRVKGFLDATYNYLATMADDSAEAVKLARASMEEESSFELISPHKDPLPEGLALYCKMSTYPLFAFCTTAITVITLAFSRRPVRQRIASAPQTRWAYSSAHLAAALVTGAIGWAWIFALGTMAFASDRLGQSGIELALVGVALAAYTLVAVGVGFVLGQLGASENASNAIAAIGGMVLSVLAGAWTSYEMLPDIVAAAARFTPGYWFNQAITGACTGQAASGALACCGVCALFALATFAIGFAVRRARPR